MISRPQIVLVAAIAFLSGCKAESPTPVEKVPASKKPADPISAMPQSEPVSVSARVPKSSDLDTRVETEKMLRDADIIAVTLLSPRSLSVKLRLKGSRTAVFKPVRKGDGRAIFETAAYRMARLLDVEKIPVSVVRRIPAAFLETRLEKDNPEIAAAFRDTVLIDDKGKVNGAVIEWMDNIDPEGLDRIGGMSAVNKMTAPGRPLEGKEPLAAAVSNMVVFDYVIGNWDRFSGGNFFVAKDGVHLVLIDHNGSFTPWIEKREARMTARLAMTERFSAALLERIRMLDGASVKKAMTDENGEGSLLNEAQIDLLLARRDEVLSHVDALVKKNGLENTIVFP